MEIVTSISEFASSLQEELAYFNMILGLYNIPFILNRHFLSLHSASTVRVVFRVQLLFQLLGANLLIEEVSFVLLHSNIVDIRIPFVKSFYTITNH
jgi:hypothetical protein